MAAIVLVHGIAQEQYAAEVLEAQWIPALAGGVRAAGHPELADRLWRGPLPGAPEVRMAFYGNAFLDPGAQGGAAPIGDDDQELSEQLAAAWLATAAAQAGNSRDRMEAQRYLDNAALGDVGQQGIGAKARFATNALTRLKWFAPFGFGLAEKFVNRSLAQVTRYLSDEAVRKHAQQQVLDLIGPETRLVIGHSLGSVVAYEALHHAPGPVTLITLGSPLALQSIIYPRLRPQPPIVPPALARWENIADRDDIVAAHLDLAPFFPPGPGGTVVPTTHPAIDNGAQPHDVAHYLTKRSVGHIVAEALSEQRHP
ncbi:hypothetical protein [Nocardia sp. NBC_01009]|uniref:hypothetical protein n=1 Tax=Nocardia sp. NBC_01009 TaxID=2975996 RepID=UPI0038681CC5|nr:GPI inositol-deacylase [Nocardia sp. NBC_01009]